MRRRRLRLRLLVLLAGVLVLPGLRVDAGATAIELHEVDGASFHPRSGEPVFVLALGSDERAGLGGARSDAIHLIGIDPGSGRATVLNIPRDTWVRVPGRGMTRINEAYDLGGAQLAAETIAAVTGVQPQLVATTTFVGLAAMVDEMGGLEIDVPMAMDDRNSGALFRAGRQRLNGGQVLAFSRNRHIPNGDFTRTEHQGLVLVAALAQLRVDGTTPDEVLRSLSVLVRHTNVDGLGVADLFRLGLLAASIDPTQVRNVTVPSHVGAVGAASVVFLDAAAAGLFADFADDGVLQAH